MMKTKPIRTFIAENRKEIDNYIRRQCPNCGTLNDDERRLWVLNDQGLYNWARTDGVQC